MVDMYWFGWVGVDEFYIDFDVLFQIGMVVIVFCGQCGMDDVLLLGWVDVQVQKVWFCYIGGGDVWIGGKVCGQCIGDVVWFFFGGFGQYYCGIGGYVVMCGIVWWFDCYGGGIKVCGQFVCLFYLCQCIQYQYVDI